MVGIKELDIPKIDKHVQFEKLPINATKSVIIQNYELIVPMVDILLYLSPLCIHHNKWIGILYVIRVSIIFPTQVKCYHKTRISPTSPII